MASAQRDAEAKRRRVVVDKHAGRVAAFTVFSPQEWDVGNAVLVPRSPGVRVSPAAAEGHKLGLGRTNASRDASVDHGAAVHTGECAGAAPPAVAQHYAETRCNAVQASVPRGFWLARKVCDSGTAAVIYDALGSAEAEAKAWTGLKLDNKSDKTYTGTADGLLMRDARYAKVWGRRKIRKMGLLEECHELTTVRRRIETLIGEIVGAELAGCVLLTEQLIKYTTDDLFFNLHWWVPSIPDHFKCMFSRGHEEGGPERRAGGVWKELRLSPFLWKRGRAHRGHWRHAIGLTALHISGDRPGTLIPKTHPHRSKGSGRSSQASSDQVQRLQRSTSAVDAMFF
eukprot:m.16019 g.16019  ORF g.16019 m.16019 type:complete len:341 (+) comp8892_c0_seq2:118-1140(+)